MSPNTLKVLSFHFFLYLIFSSSIFFVSCNRYIQNVEARNDEKEYNKALEGQSKISNHLQAVTETDTVYAGIDDDAADDPAIWLHPTDPSKSVVFGSNKKSGGIHAFDLKGHQIQYIKIGMINNIDIRQGVKWGNSFVDILGGSNRTKNSITLFVLDEEGQIDINNRYDVELGVFQPYGFCLSKDKEGHLLGYVNSKKGDVYQFSLDLDAIGKLSSDLTKAIKLKTQVEGMVVDDQSELLYVGEEEVGIHVFDLSKNQPKEATILLGSSMSNKNIRYDIEGLALLPPHYLIASSQGNFSYAIFDLQTQAYITSFTILDGVTDGVEETDGLEVLNVDLGAPYKKGILVVQDGFNFDGNKKRSQNFKYINLEEVYRLLENK